MPDWLYGVAGGVLLVVLVLDVFWTVFHAEGRGGPLNRRQNQMIWRGVRWAGTLGRKRADVLSLAGPLMALTTIGVWSLLLISGFALIHLPRVLTYHFASGQPGSALLEAFYYSGIVGSTLGQGDIIATGAAHRVLTVLQAVAGFALVTVAVTYVLGIYRELIVAQGLATALDARLLERSESEMDAATIRNHDLNWDRSITLRLARVLEAHFNFPVLHYFRASRSHRALPIQIAKMLAASREMSGESASHRALRTLMERYIGDVHALFVHREATWAGDAGKELTQLRQILDMMAYEDPTEAGDHSGPGGSG